ncbi:TNF receptor-associated factor 2-like [Clytia hemisphaerica]|uniref:TNF receptor-associated factor n=1 Tax=Clytia hemisphaerica TaxID=252671 RepID=A0A7M5XEZ2_9CNID|eukprot:TCONS_00011460-protein
MATAVTFKELSAKNTDVLNYELLPKINNFLLETLPESLKCFSCQNILQRPQQLSCGHRVCLHCVEDVVNRGNRFCPEDGYEIEKETFPDRSAMKDIMLLSCYCLRKNDGCDWFGVIMDLEQHHTKDCPYGDVFVCKFQQIGCRGKGQNIALEKHYQHDFVYHHTLLAAGMAATLNITKQPENLLTEEQIDSKLEELGRTDQELMLKEHEIKKSELSQLKLNTFVNELYGKIEKVLTQKSHYEIVLDQHLEKAQKLKGLDSRTADAKIATLQSTVDRIQSTYKSQKIDWQKMDMQSKICLSTTNGEGYLWKMDQFKQRVLETIEYENSPKGDLFTPPLYTELYGHRFCIKVNLGGGIEGSHISLYMVIMQSKLDEILDWPFPYIVKLTLINPNSKKNIEHLLVPTPELPHFQQPLREQNMSIGFPRFVSHETLHADNFIIDDAIFIHIQTERVPFESN